MTHVIVCVIDYGIEIEIEIGFQCRWWAPSETRWCCGWSPHTLLLSQKTKTWPTLTNIIKIASPLMSLAKPPFTRFVISEYSVLTTTDTSSSCLCQTRLDTPCVSSLFCIRGIFFFFWVVEIQLIPSPCKKWVNNFISSKNLLANDAI